jgi:hypothetical protein
MARTSNALKSSTVLSSENATTMVVPELKDNKKNASVIAAIEKALKGARNLVQTAQQLEPLITDASNKCLIHCQEHGDAMPADRLVKGLMACGHPTTSSLAREVIAWFSGNSPIRWDSKKNVRVLKEGEDGYKPFDIAKAEEAGPHETPAAKRARDVAAAAHRNSLAAADMGMLVKRTSGVITFLNNMITGKDERPIKDGELPKMKKLATRLNDVLKEFGGETAVVPLAKPKTEGKASKKAA